VRAALSVLHGWDIFERLSQALRSRNPVALDGVSGAAKAYLLAGLADQHASPVLILTHSADAADELADDLSAFLSPERVLLVPSLDTLFYEEMRPDRALIRDRLTALLRLLAGERVVLVASAAAALHLTLPPAVLDQARRTIHAGADLPPDRLIADLVNLGYERHDLVESPGEFSVRGGIVDIYPSTSDPSGLSPQGRSLPLRIEYFGDEITSLRAFDPETQRSLAAQASIERFHLLPAREILISPEQAQPVRAALERQVAFFADAGKHEQGARPSAATAAPTSRGLAADRLEDKVGRDLAALEQGAYSDNAEYYLPLLFPDAATLLDYLPADAAVFLDEPVRIAERYGHFLVEAEEIYHSNVASGMLLPLPRPLYRPLPEAMRQVRTHPTLDVALLPGHLFGEPVSVTTEPVDNFGAQMDLLVHSLRDWQRRGRRIVAATYQADRLAEILADAAVPNVLRDGSAPAISAGQVLIASRKVSGGFHLPEPGLVLLTDAELFGWRRLPRAPRRRRAEGVSIASVTQLAPADYVVHINHGIGVYDGLVHQTVEGVEREYLLIRYAGPDKLYVPVDQLDRVQKYIGGEDAEPTINRLQGMEWQRAKQRARAKARELAAELVRLYAARQSQPGHAFSPDTPWQREMEEGFPYEETPDQWQVIVEVKRDMEQRRPMDRLVCGDVGYGKTEVAIRAAFKAVMDGKQVAVLVPTTVLAQQHFSTFSERLAPYPIRVEMLSRFRSRPEQLKVVQALKDGTVDVVIATHRLLSRDVEFKDLGLLVVDEEQRFGVRHKEKIKQLKTIVDVLTMTATPIPRTLHMALSGIRDMSVINDPPEGRMSIRTKAMPRDDEMLREAMTRELERSGQVYFVHNRVESIGHIAAHVQKLMPSARIAVGHGQLKEDELERVMLDVYAGESDILVCTAIIESGLDIPNVNTIVVDQSERFGLAQLYQLRGRVGRSNRQAYAYLTWTPFKRLTDAAEKRIAAIREFSQLGSGFKIALRDLEIRGAGNLLGPEQSGFIAAVGFELYTQMLAEAVREEKGEEVAPEAPAVSLDLPVDAFIPDEYVLGLNQRIDLYRRMAALRDEEGAAALRAEIEDRFGTPLPRPVLNLFRLIELKQACLRAGVPAVVSERHRVAIKFAQDRWLPQFLARSLARRLEAIALPEMRLACPSVAHDRVTFSTQGLEQEQILTLTRDLIDHLTEVIPA